MEIFKTKIEDILKFPFEKNDWLSKFGIYTLIIFLNSFLIIFILSLAFFGVLLILETQNPFLIIVITTFLAFFTLLSFVLQIYTQGYLLEIIKNTKENRDDLIPEHRDIIKKIKYGWDKFLLALGPMIIAFLILTIAIIIILFSLPVLETTALLGALLIIISSFKILLAIALMFLTGTLIIPAMVYLYLESNSVKNGYCFKNIKIIIKNMWKEFLILYAIAILGAMIVSTIGQMPGIGFFIILIGTTYMSFIISFLTGKIFLKIDKLKLFK